MQSPAPLLYEAGQTLLEGTPEFDYLTHIVFRMYENKQVWGQGARRRGGGGQLAQLKALERMAWTSSPQTGPTTPPFVATGAQGQPFIAAWVQGFPCTGAKWIGSYLPELVRFSPICWLDVLLSLPIGWPPLPWMRGSFVSILTP